jgi:hypothetical protein
MHFKTISAFAAALALAACSSEPPPPPAQVAVQPAPTAPNNYMVFFDWDRANISPQADGVIQQAAQAHRNGGMPPVSVTGHADKSGANDYNMALSLRRANAVKDGLVRAGVGAQAISVAGRGEEQPLVATADGVREPQNRRVEISMSGGQARTGVVYFQGDDLAYCKHLSALYRRNVAQSNSDSVAGAAMAKCDAGDYANAIPTLLRLLRDARFEFPYHQNWD